MPPYGDCPCFDYGEDGHDVEGYPGLNTLILGDFNARSSDTEGRLFVCGDANIDDYSIGDKLDSDDSRDDLYVRGTLNYQTGRVMAGNIKYGVDAVIGTSLAHGMYNRTVTQISDSRYDCSGANSYFRGKSLTLGAQEATGTTLLHDDGTFDFIRQGSLNVEYFELDCEILSDISHMTFQGIPLAQTVVINWRGDECIFRDQSIVPGDSQMVVFNFPQASTVSIKTAAIEANILAPFATVTGNGAVVNGQVVALNWNGNTQQNWRECKACI